MWNKSQIKKKSCFQQTVHEMQKNGHFAKLCRTKKNNANKQKNRVNAIEESSNSDDEVYISTIITGEKKNWTENVQVGSVKFTVKLDTGAECNVLPRHLMDKAKGRLKPSRTKILISYTDDRMAVLGETDLQCKLKNEKQNITFKVVEERVMPILGLNTCEKLGLIARVRTLKEGTDDIFEGLGCYKDYEYDIDLIENPKLEIKASRKIPHAIRHEVKQELDRMVKLDVIKPETAPTPAVSPMVIAKQKASYETPQTYHFISRPRNVLTNPPDALTGAVESLMEVNDSNGQITRFAIRSRRGPHVQIGTDAKKILKKEIERRIEAIPRIVHEPRLLSTEPSHYILEPQQPYHYRFRAVDDVQTLEQEIARQDSGLKRHPRESLRAFLLSSLAAPLDGHGQKLVHQFCDTYEYARHHPGDFGEEEYQAYSRLLMKLLDAARLLKSVGTCPRTSPRGTPARRPARLLDAARLRPGLAALPGANKLPAALHKHYTALENMPADSKLEDEVLTVPVRFGNETKTAAPADETAV
ncbi:Uncharacterized protein C1orf43 homolog [Eumeta japonica]|uniref:Uncharacterized protein C1orf43 homolog n=1 Tax=Eumeta variegata TaxID=151549 RepID=A0A4C1XLJ4_EUMVA|nr:Uncharacterized protein C1orf43 homolog [Eumeta japonica]